MLFLRLIKKNFKFSTLIILIFFISCAVEAQDLPNKALESMNSLQKIIKSEDSPSSAQEALVKNDDNKKQIKKPAKSSKKFSKKSKKIFKNKKKIKRKILKKRIIKKVNIEKNIEEKKVEEVSVSKPEKKIKIDESLEKYKKGELNNFQEIDGAYLIEVELKDNCDRITGESCFRSDKFFQEPYFHYTTLSIFNQKVIAEQFFEGDGRVKDKVFVKVKDGEYLLYTKNQNKIFLIVKSGVVNELVALGGDLNKESKIISKCQYADKLLAFHRLYKTKEHNEETLFYTDVKNFKGVIEATIFSQKYQPKDLYAIFKIPNKEIRVIQNLNLCKIGDNFQAIERDFTKNECNKKLRCTMKTLANYGSEGFSVNDKIFSFYDLDKNNATINLNKEEANGLLQEVSKLSAEDKSFLKSRCFNDKNIDIISCSIYEKCQDHLAVEACEVNYFYDFYKENN